MEQQQAGNWYRVAFGGDGKVASVERVEAVAGGSLTIIYVQAADEATAKAEARRLRANAHMAARRKKLEAAGLCRCGRHRDRAPLKKCSVCFAKGARDLRNSRARRRGDPVEPHDKRAAFADRAADKAREVRLETLREVRAMVGRAKSFAEIDDYLRVEMAKAGQLRAVG